jgi:tetratricopeptide (TPR) repeat protein
VEAGLREAARRYAGRDYEGALAALDEVDATEGNRLDLAYILGLCHARLGDWDDSLLYLEQVVTGSEDLLRVYQCRLALAYVYSVTGRSRLAEYELERLMKAGFRSVQVLSSLAYAAYRQGRLEEAERRYDEALDLDPESATALNGLGYILACEGREAARALTCCRKAVDKAPRNPAYLDSLGWAYHVLGFETEAKDYVARALAIAPEPEEIREHARALGLAEPGSTEEQA